MIKISSDTLKLINKLPRKKKEKVPADSSFGGRRLTPVVSR